MDIKLLHLKILIMLDFNPGDVVCLKSNKSIKMTLRWVEKDEACCDWFIGKELKQAMFPLTSLSKDCPEINYGM